MILVLAAASALHLSASPPPPFGSARHPVTREVASPASTRREPPTGDFLGVAYGFYRSVVTQIDGPRCSHRPTCSAYAREAVSRHGLVGVWLAYDRLLRDTHSSAARRLLVAMQHGRIVFLDPLEDSTFWLP